MGPKLDARGGGAESRRRFGDGQPLPLYQPERRPLRLGNRREGVVEALGHLPGCHHLLAARERAKGRVIG